MLDLSDEGWPRPEESMHEIIVELGRKRAHLKTGTVLSIGKLDNESLKKFHYAMTDLKAFLNNLINAHFKKKPL